eukprot:7635179-Alexandrium_andersonii.AAC.1
MLKCAPRTRGCICGMATMQTVAQAFRPRHAVNSSCPCVKERAPSNCESASHARVVASAARRPCRLRPQFHRPASRGGQ